MKRTIVILIAVLALCACASADDSGRSRVVVVVAGGMSVRDVVAPGLPHLARLMVSGAAAVMNVRTGRPTKDVEPMLQPGMEPGCVSIGAGAMAVGGAEARRACNTDGNLNGVFGSALYESRMGQSAGRARVLHTEIAKMTRINGSASYRAIPGLLGSQLHTLGIKTAVIGNSDMPGEAHREAVAIAMDESGRVDFGDTDSEQFHVSDPSSPYGIRSDPASLLSAFDGVGSKARFVVIDFGDTLRADRYAEDCTDEQAVVLRRQASVALGRFIARLTPKLDLKKDLLVVISPSARSISELENEQLGVVLIAGPGYVGGGYAGGMLMSPSTHRAGVVTISDIAPTILGFFGAKPPLEMVGRALGSVQRSNAADELLAMNLDAAMQGQRQVAMRGASVAQSVVVVLVTLIVLGTTLPALRRVAGWMALIPAVLPLVMLYMPAFYSGGLVGAVVLLVVLTLAVVGFCALAFRAPLRALAWLCAALVVSLTVDMVRGGHLTASSIAGYNMIEGARYYGIGNELMGTMLGAAVIGVALILSSRRIMPRFAGAIAALVFVVVFVMIGAPKFGANLGGSLAVVPAVVVTLLLRRGWRPSVRGVVMVAVVTVAVVGALFAVDAAHSGAAQSHVGRVAGLATGGDMLDVLLVFQRKMALNFMLVSTSVWSRLLGLSLLSCAIMAWWAKSKFGDGVFHKEQSAAAVGCIVGVVGAFVFNDSGVVAAGCCVVFPWMLLALGILRYSDTKRGRRAK